MSLLVLTDRGLYCAQADVYIDPQKSVNNAIITHAHADHAKPGMGAYLCHEDCVPLLKVRLGKKILVQGLPYGERLTVNGVKISLHPAGHITGSAQVRLEYQGEVWVVSGDYKTAPDGFCAAFEPIPCHVFVTESTFGLPIYHWQSQAVVFEEMKNWWQHEARQGKLCLMHAYSLGKAQRLILGLNECGKIYVHPAIAEINEAVRFSLKALPEVEVLHAGLKAEELRGALVITPDVQVKPEWEKMDLGFSFAMASGWMRLKTGRQRNPGGTNFVLSDHADWSGLCSAVQATGAGQIYVTHGFTEAFSGYLNGIGLQAKPLDRLMDERNLFH